jgi:hypothetical protein
VNASHFTTDPITALAAAAANAPGVSFNASTNTLTFGPGTQTGTPSDFAGTATIGATANSRWTNPSNAVGNTPSDFAESDVDKNDSSDQLKLTNFGFNIPTGATINGITVTLVTTGSSDPINQPGIQLTKDGSTAVGTAPTTFTQWSTGSVVIGGATNVWGTTWTAADLNSSNFGLLIQPEAGADGQVFRIYTAKVAVSYSLPVLPTSLSFTATIADDHVVEGDQSYSLNLSNPQTQSPGFAFVQTPTATTTILSDDIMFSITGSPSVTEDANDSDNNQATYTIGYTGTFPSGGFASVNVAESLANTHTGDFVTDPITALASAAASLSGVSFNQGTGTLTFSSGGPKSVSFAATIADAHNPSDETYSVNLSNAQSTSPGATMITTALAATTIFTDDIAFSITGGTSVNEDPSTGDTVNYTIGYSGHLSPGEGASVVVTHNPGTTTSADYTTAPYSAIQAALASAPGISFNGSTDTLTFTGGSGNATSLTFTVQVADRHIHGGTKSYSISLSNPTTQTSGSASITTSSVQTTINDNDNLAPVFQQSSYSFSVPSNAVANQVIGTITATDPDGDSITYSGPVSSSAPFAVNPTTGAVSWTGGPVAQGTLNLVFTATDSFGSTATTNAAVTVGPGIDTKLKVLQQPSTGTVGVPSNPPVQVAIEDQFGNVDTTSGSGTDLVADWTGNGTANDVVANHNGTLVNGAGFGSGQFGQQAFQLNGTDQYVSVPVSAWNFGSNPFTIAVMANFTTLRNDQNGSILIGQDQGGGNQNKWFFTLLGNGVLALRTNSPSSGPISITSPFGALGNGGWHLFAVTRSGNTFTFFSDGSWGTVTYAGAIPNPNAPLTIGQAEGIGFWNGLIENVQIYNQALSLSQLSQLANAAPQTATVAVNSGPGGFTTGSTTAAAVVNGVATFPNLALDTAGSYTLSAADGTLAGATSGNISISPATDNLTFSITGGASVNEQPLPVNTGNTVNYTVAYNVGHLNTGERASVVVNHNVGTTTSADYTTAPYAAIINAINSGSFPGVQFDSSTGTLTFTGGSGNATILTFTVEVADQHIHGGTKSYSIDLSNPTWTQTTGSASITTSSVQTTIYENYDQAPVFQQSSYSFSVPDYAVTNQQLRQIKATDPDGDPFTYGGPVSSSAPFAIDPTTGIIYWTGGPVAQGTLTLVFTATDSFGLTGTTNAIITVGPGDDNNLKILQQPSTGTAGVALSPPVKVAVEDQFGNVDTTMGSGLVADWTGNGTTNDLVAGHNGTLVNGAGFASGQFGQQAFQLNGTNQYVSVPSNSWNFGNNPFTIAVMAYYGHLNGNPNQSILVGQDEGGGNQNKWFFTLLPNGDLAFVINSPSSGPITIAGPFLAAVSYGGWYLLAVTRSGNTFTFDVNGSGGDTTYTGPAIPNPNAPLTIGAAEGIGFWDGLIENVQIYNQALSWSQLAQLQRGALPTVGLAVASGPAGFTAGSTTTAVVVNGVATFSNLTLDTAGAYTLSAADGALTGATSSNISIGSAAASQLAYQQTPTTGTAGQALSPAITVSVDDQFGNLVTSDTSTITLSVASGPGGFAPGSTVVLPASGGIATFNNVVFDTAGTYALNATDGTLIGATSGSVVISAAAASQLVFQTVPGSGTAGIALSPAVTVDVEDQFGNLVTTDTSQVSLNVATGPGVLTGTTMATASGGIATFNNLLLDTAGTYTLSAGDGTYTRATSSNIVISPAAAFKVAFQTVPGTGTAGTPLGSVTVAVEDQFGNVVTSDSSSTVTLTVASGPGNFVGITPPLTAPVHNGIATFNGILFDAAGTYTLGASDGTLAAGTSGNIVISPSSATQLAFLSPFPATGIAGAALSPAVKVAVEDQFGNVETGDITSTVALSVSSGPVSVFDPSSTSTVTASGGIATFNNVALDKVGTYALSAQDGSITSQASTSIVISPATASQLVFQSVPTTGTAGAALSPAFQVLVEDRFNNLVTSQDGTTVTLTDNGPGSIFGTPTAPVTGGIATFNDVVLQTAGTYTLSARDGSLVSPLASNNITISPAAAAKLLFTQQPASGGFTTLSPQPQVTVEDAFSNVVTTDQSLITLQAVGPGQLIGVTMQHAQNGVATFPGLTLSAPGSYTITATDGSLTSDTTASFLVNDPPAFNSSSYSFNLADNATTGTAVGTVSATDADGETALQFSGPTPATAPFAIDPATGQITYTGTTPPQFRAVFNLVITVTDAFGATATTSVTVNVVAATNGPPTLALFDETGGTEQAEPSGGTDPFAEAERLEATCQSAANRA